MRACQICHELLLTFFCIACEQMFESMWDSGERNVLAKPSKGVDQLVQLGNYMIILMRLPGDGYGWTYHVQWTDHRRASEALHIDGSQLFPQHRCMNDKRCNMTENTYIREF